MLRGHLPTHAVDVSGHQRGGEAADLGALLFGGDDQTTGSGT